MTDKPTDSDEATEGRLPARACYLIERGHHSRPGKWEVMGEFVVGSPWRDGRPVADETMREEVEGYRRTWPAYLARVRCPNGEILSDNGMDEGRRTQDTADTTERL